MVEIIIVCATVLIIAAMLLWFGDKHVRSTKAWRAELLSYLDGRTQKELDNFQKNLFETLASVKKEVTEATLDAKKSTSESREAMFKCYADMEVINRNQIDIGEEVKSLKATTVAPSNLSMLRRGPPKPE